jgi:hypothetical protein
MAQIMKYWEYPVRGTGFHSYNHDNFGIIAANFSETEYNWDDKKYYPFIGPLPVFS